MDTVLGTAQTSQSRQCPLAFFSPVQNTGCRCRGLRQSCSSCGGEKELLQSFTSTSVRKMRRLQRSLHRIPAGVAAVVQRALCCCALSLLLESMGARAGGSSGMVVQCWAYEVQWCSSSASVNYSYLQLLAIMSCLQLEVHSSLSVLLHCGEMMLLCKQA